MQSQYESFEAVESAVVELGYAPPARGSRDGRVPRGKPLV